MKESPKIARRRAREKKTISQMIAIYCHGNHAREDQTFRAYCGEMLCEQCAMIDQYSVSRTDRCRNMEMKTSCEECENHCYAREEREMIRQIMRYAGPRMLTHHPIAGIRHLLRK